MPNSSTPAEIALGKFERDFGLSLSILQEEAFLAGYSAGEPKWIPVGEFKPRPRERVLLGYAGSDDFEFGEYRYERQCMGESPHNQRGAGYVSYESGNLPVDPDYIMKLPAPPPIKEAKSE